jgi:hypothetical protein
MFTLIIIILVAIFAVGALKSMSPSERAIVIRRTLNMLTFGIVYLFRAGKGAASASYQSGRIAGTTLALEGQETLASMKQHNSDVESKGGAAREAIRSSISHADALGLSSMNVDLKAKADALELQLVAKRAELDAL